MPRKGAFPPGWAWLRVFRKPVAEVMSGIAVRVLSSEHICDKKQATCHPALIQIDGVAMGPLSDPC